ncbi:GWxTD domain-containing protein [bacterium]|nr:GWxTD domain-containing protein [bacterium]MBU1937260.1 GWxTD domain-containing protein [bacterium]
MRYVKASALLVLLWSSQHLFAGLAIDLDHATYRGRDSLMYVEVFTSVQRSQLHYVKTDSAFIAEFQLALELILQGEVIVADTLFGFDMINDENKLKPGQFFPHLFAFYMRPGYYEARATLKDETGALIERKTLPMEVKFIPEEILSISDIELACHIQMTDEPTRFWKNGLQVLPNPVKFYGTQLPLFYYYCELYTFHFSAEVPDSFLVERQIRSAETGEIARTFPPRKKQKVGTTAVEADGFPISVLRTGTYVFEIKVTDLYDNRTAWKKKKFWIYRPEDFEAGREFAMDTAFVGRLAEFTLPAMEIENAEIALEQMRHILTSEELSRVRRLTLDGKIQFMREYWKQKALEEGTSPEMAQWNYFLRVKEANRRYSYLKKEGWKTDRGRVFIQLGAADLIDYNTASQEVPDYEVWYYDKIEGGVKFVFADRAGFGNLELVHSTKRGEMYDSNWLEKLAGRPLSEPDQISR